MKNFIDVNGTQVLDLTPNHDRALALVDLNVLDTLVGWLPKADSYGIIQEFIQELASCDAELEVAVKRAEEFVAFHKTVNIIKELRREDINSSTNRC